MSILTTPSAAFSTSLVYITLGTLIDIWTIVALVFYPPSTDWGHFLVVGLLVSGIALLIIGLLLGPIGRAARNAELPPAEVTSAITQAEQTAAANPPAVVPANNSIPQGVLPVEAGTNGTVVIPAASAPAPLVRR